MKDQSTNNDSNNLLLSIEDYLNTEENLKNLSKEVVDLIPSKLILDSLVEKNWEAQSTILVGVKAKTNLKKIRLDILEKTRDRQRCYQKSNHICGFFGDISVWSYFFKQEKQLVLLFFCEENYLLTFKELIRQDALNISQIKNKKQSLNLNDKGYGYPLG